MLVNLFYKESKSKNYFLLRIQIENKCLGEGWGGGAARVSEFIYYESTFKIKKIYFFFWGGGV